MTMSDQLVDQYLRTSERTCAPTTLHAYNSLLTQLGRVVRPQAVAAR